MMAVVDLKFSKSDSGQHWGFRLVGGADFDYPVVVVKVDESSLAEAAGLEAGDIIVRIGDTPTSGLTHVQVHDLLLSSGLEFVLGVRKGKLPASVISGEDYDLQFAEMVKELEQSVEKEILEEAMKRFKEIDPKDLGSLPENLAGQEEVAYAKETESKSLFSEALTHGIKKDKKWSTFMMKPEKPVPKQPRKVEGERKVEVEAYRVVIRKQPPKRFFAKKVSFDQNVIQVEVPPVEESETNEEDEAETFNGEVSEDTKAEADEGEKFPEDEEEEMIEDQEGYDNDESDNAEDYKMDSTTEEVRYKPLSEIVVETPENRTTLEEQLREVQKQLQLLSQLPSAVQLTLDTVSKQLASLIQEEQKEQDEEEVIEESAPIKEEEEECTVSERAVAENEEDADSVIGEELEEDVVNDEIREIMEKVEEVEEEKGLTEEELEAMRREEELQAKKEKDPSMERRPHVRPIVLPGGRRWTDPEDATPPPPRRPRMSEEEIIETIDSNLEVIAGKRKGINFLKYQPPPKNLDYLQRSEVYRLVHGMEPQTKGIVTRPELIPSVQDYYEASRDGL